MVTFTAAEKAIITSNDQCRMATVGKDGWPHCVPVGYVYKDRLFYIPSDKRTKKISNIRTNKKVCIVIDDENSGAGVTIQGYAEMIEDERFTQLKNWMEQLTGWSISGYRKGLMLVIRPVRKASWELE